MIRSKKGNVIMKGNLIDINADYAAITLSIMKTLMNTGLSHDKAKEILQKVFDIAIREAV